MSKILLIALSVLFLQGCSSRSAYEALQSRQKVECSKLPQTKDYEECMQRAGESFDSYTQKRENALENK